MNDDNHNPLYDAYSARAPVHPRVGEGQRPLAPSEARIRIDKLLGRPRAKGLPATAYFHIPYCDSRCTFCPFYKKATTEAEFAPYVEALISQLRLWGKREAICSQPLESVYIGGGTPSAMPSNLLVTLLHAIRANLPLADDVEWTMEGRPSNIEEDKYRAAFDMGVTRVSFGVQSFNTAIRRSVGRKLSSEELEIKLGKVVSWGFRQVALDLIFGLPGQTMEIWREDLRRAIDLGTAGIATYRLQTYPGSTLGKQIASGAVHIPSDNEMTDMFLAGRELLFAAGYGQIEPVHYGLPGRESYRYGKTVWNGGNCYPFGAGAGGNIGPVQLFLEREPETYISEVANGTIPVKFALLMNDEARFQRRIQYELTHDGLDFGTLATERGEEDILRYRKRAEDLRRRGLVGIENELARLTQAGIVWSNEVSEDLVKSEENQMSEMMAAMAAVGGHPGKKPKGHPVI